MATGVIDPKRSIGSRNQKPTSLAGASPIGGPSAIDCGTADMADSGAESFEFLAGWRSPGQTESKELMLGFGVPGVGISG